MAKWVHKSTQRGRGVIAGRRVASSNLVVSKEKGVGASTPTSLRPSIPCRYSRTTVPTSMDTTRQDILRRVHWRCIGIPAHLPHQCSSADRLGYCYSWRPVRDSSSCHCCRRQRAHRRRDAALRSTGRHWCSARTDLPSRNYSRLLALLLSAALLFIALPLARVSGFGAFVAEHRYRAKPGSGGKSGPEEAAT